MISQSFEEFVRDTSCVHTFSSLVRIFLRNIAVHGYDSVVVFRLKAGRLAAMPVVQGNEELTANYLKNDDSKVNPVFQYLRQTSEPFFWLDLYNKAGLTSAQKKILKQFENDGAASGLTIPLPSQEGEQAMICLTSRQPGIEPHEELSIINAKCMQFWLMLQRLDGGQRVRDDQLLQEILTPREIECLELCLHFESTKSIANFLERAEQTIQFHISNAIHKLGVQNRTQAVAKACVFGLIGKSLLSS